jgi:hypothetical protein
MPLRFRRSIRLGKGIRFNLSKSGISTSIGKPGATVNIGKRGVKTTVSIPGSGLSYSKNLSSNQQPTTRRPALKNNNASGDGSGCLNGLVGLIALPFRVFGDVIKSIGNPETRRSSLIIFSSLLGVCLLFFGGLSVWASLGGSNTPTATIDMLVIQNTAKASAYQSFTMTALAMPTQTFTVTFVATETATLIPIATNTFLPTNTASPSSTPKPTATIYIPPAPPVSNHPPGTSGQCKDGSYTSAQHKQGACSHHGGVSIWWGP